MDNFEAILCSIAEGKHPLLTCSLNRSSTANLRPGLTFSDVAWWLDLGSWIHLGGSRKSVDVLGRRFAQHNRPSAATVCTNHRFGSSATLIS